MSRGDRQQDQLAHAIASHRTELCQAGLTEARLEILPEGILSGAVTETTSIRLLTP